MRPTGKIAAIRAAGRHAFPAPGIDQMLAEIEQGYPPMIFELDWWWFAAVFIALFVGAALWVVLVIHGGDLRAW